MIDKLEQLLQQLVQKVEDLSSQSEKLRKQIDDLYEAYGQSGTDDNPLAKVPLIAAETSRALLEAESRKWKVVAMICSALLLATCIGIILSVLL